jgi:hypothetical protein
VSSSGDGLGGQSLIRIFIDTEFSDFKNPQLISIALVDEDWREFYAELPVDRTRCNQFVIDNVLPLLGRELDAQCSGPEELHARINAWLLPLEDKKPDLCYDFEGDWILFSQAMLNQVPAWLTPVNVYRHIDPLTFQAYQYVNHLPQHHALYDARANKRAFNPAFIRDDSPLFPMSR